MFIMLNRPLEAGIGLGMVVLGLAIYFFTAYLQGDQQSEVSHE